MHYQSIPLMPNLVSSRWKPFFRGHLTNYHIVQLSAQAPHNHKLTIKLQMFLFNLLFFSRKCWEKMQLATRLSFPSINTLRRRQNGCHVAEDIFKCIFLNENVWIPIKISLKFGPKGPINNIPALVQIMARRRPGNKPLSEPMMLCLTTHICVTLPQ